MSVKKKYVDDRAEMLMEYLRQERSNREGVESDLREQVRLLLDHFELKTGLVHDEGLIIKKR